MDSFIEALESARVGEVFRSRKNRVFRVVIGGETLVAKVYPLGGDELARHERSMLEGCVERGMMVPRPVRQSGRSLLMEYIEGTTAAQAIDSDPGDAQSILFQVVDWLSIFHRAHDFRLRRGDCVLHNFLLTSRGVAGVDFEEACDGDPLEDLGQVIASFLSMRPAFVASKMAVARRVAAEYLKMTGLDRGTEVPQAVSDALRHYAAFREDGDDMRTWADRIAREGLASGKE